MKLNGLLVACLFVTACGGKSQAPKPPPPPDDMAEEDSEPEEASEPEAVPEPPPPQEWRARAALVPVKGSKMKPGAVSFSQTEGEGVQVSTEGPLQGLKVGKYHLVIHEASECGKNAAKVGPPWAGAAAVSLEFAVAKNSPGVVDEPGVELTLDGEDSLVGHALVVHADKKGKPGAAEACGVIVAVDPDVGSDDDLDD